MPDLAKYPDVKLETASSIVIIDDSGPVSKYLMGLRSEGHVFLPGFHVFPGGRAEKADLEVAKARPPILRDSCALRITGGKAGRSEAEALAVTALRELREETGYIPVTDTPELIYFARAITPQGYPRRYDTRFFVGFSKDFQSTRATVDDELLDVQWVASDAMDELKIHYITQHVIGFLNDWIDQRKAGLTSIAVPCLKPVDGKHRLEYE